ncbi:MAG TPA: hypothetical protein V6C89_10200 [Drouetiella sp.]|jgi:hypothetical protein
MQKVSSGTNQIQLSSNLSTEDAALAEALGSLTETSHRLPAITNNYHLLATQARRVVDRVSGVIAGVKHATTNRFNVASVEFFESTSELFDDKPTEAEDATVEHDFGSSEKASDWKPFNSTRLNTLQTDNVPNKFNSIASNEESVDYKALGTLLADTRRKSADRRRKNGR